MARNSRVLVTKLLCGTSIRTYTPRSTCYQLHGSLNLTSTQSTLSVYRWQLLSGTSTQIRSYTPGPRTITSIPTPPPETSTPNWDKLPEATTWNIIPDEIFYRDFILCPHLGPDFYDKIQDESMNAICCYFAFSGDKDYNHSYHIIQKFLEQYPHVRAFHCIIPECYETAEPRDDVIDALEISSLPMFHFYKNGKKVVDLDGTHIIGFKKVLKKLYKPAITSVHNHESNQQSSGDLAFNQIQTTSFSTSVHTPESNQQSSVDLAFNKTQGPVNFELILSEEYNLGANGIQDENLPEDAVLCFATYLEFSSCMVYSLLHNKISEEFPHVAIYYVLLSRKEDGYKTTLESLNICPKVEVPTFRFFKKGEMVVEVACLTADSDVYCDLDVYCTYIEETFKKLYKTEHTTTQEIQHTRSKDREGVRGQRERIVKELDYSLALEDIIKDAGIIHGPNKDNSEQQMLLWFMHARYNSRRARLEPN